MANNQQFTNNAASTLSAGINASVTSITLTAGGGALFPALSGSQYFYGTISNSSGTVIEIVKVTARSTDTLTVVRAQDNTTASSFSAGDNFQLRVTAAAFNNTGQIDSANTWSQTQTMNITGNASGNAGTATKLATARNIQGVSFDGTSDITVATAGTGISVTGTSIANTGVTSAVAGTGISVSGATGAVTITASAPTTTDVLNATAGASMGAVGTYAMLTTIATTTTVYASGSTVAGSSMAAYGVQMGGTGANAAQAAGTYRESGVQSGTWRWMGSATPTTSLMRGSVLLRIA